MQFPKNRCFFGCVDSVSTGPPEGIRGVAPLVKAIASQLSQQDKMRCSFTANQECEVLYIARSWPLHG